MTDTTWRPRRARIVPYVLGAAVVLATALLAVAMPPPWSLADRVGLVLIGLVIAGGLHLLARSRVSAGARGLTIVNGPRTREYAWAQVLGVSMAEGAPWPTLDLADGSSVSAMGIQSADGERARNAVRDLAVMIRERGEARWDT